MQAHAETDINPNDTPLLCTSYSPLVQATLVHTRTNPLLAWFASEQWHASSNPILLDEWVAETRAVARVIESLGQVGAHAWIEYVESDHVRTSAVGPSRRGECRCGGLVAGASGVNRMDVAALVVAYLREDRFNEARRVVERMSTASEGDGDLQEVNWMHVLDWIKTRIGPTCDTSNAMAENNDLVGFGLVEVARAIMETTNACESVVDDKWLIEWECKLEQASG
ncbi:hypothetical protein BCR44DRAFT_225636 [Catenaria anguillulae PL171]|uniref:Uncharacterized protein n=1 Tax=Catenaria anguillulae PL171 TaxID=765915 RepID=A0A1Y2I5S3_9FUNG|nr:hypothetical protein BCR44DRAFT_225636 [Catenaria anguillulae PL171]